MADVSFLGIDKAQWELLNSFANWFAAIGSFAAAGVALYLANRSAKPRAQVNVGYRVMVTPGEKGPYPEYVMFRIVNTGDRPIRITQIGWKTGLFRKRFAIQTFEPLPISSNLPIEITHGQDASWFIPLSGQGQPWLDRFAKKMLCTPHQVALWTIKAQFFSSVGYTFETKIEEGLRQKFKAACKMEMNTSS
jgi:hypothetical protein